MQAGGVGTRATPETRAEYKAAALVTPLAGSKRYRLEIEGLRAVAALLVAVYHVWFGKVSGGVDVFFVVAGFMMTTTVLGHYERYGRLRTGMYFGRLFSRLLPNALLVLGVVSIATVTLLPVTSWRPTFREVAASALYWENWALIERSVDYLERDDASSPVQHFWAMSVQGQFYLLWVIVALAAFVVRGRRSLDRSLLLTIALVSTASFVFSVLLTAADQPVAYFHTLARVWEFGAGGLTALAVRRGMQLTGLWSTALGWLGLVLIISCGMVLPVQDAFPGWAAMWPVTGAVLILFAGQSPTRLSASGVLSRPSLVRLGSVSYALYLWHWPLLVVWLHLSGRTQAGFLDGAAVITVSVVLAFASTTFVEKPLRSLASTVGHTVTVVTGAAVALAVAGLALASSHPEPTRTTVEGLVGAELVETAREGDTMNLAHGNTDQPLPGIPAAAEDVPSIYKDGCAAPLQESDVITCEYGDREADRTLVLTGGSHSAHWLPGLDRAARERGWRVVTLIKNGCKVGYAPAPQEERKEFVSCGEWNERALPAIVELAPELVVMTYSQSGRDEPERLPAGYSEVWAELGDHAIPVLALRDTPRAVVDRVECLATEGTTSPACDVRRQTTLNEQDPIHLLDPRPDNVHFADLTRYFCDDAVCPAVIGNTVVYSDRNHITATYSRSLSGVLGGLLQSSVDGGDLSGR